jgi:hypothetical protein
MHYFMRFTGADGMHAGYLPGYPASHGCVRMPQKTRLRFSIRSASELRLLCSEERRGPLSRAIAIQISADRNRFATRFGPRSGRAFGPSSARGGREA